MIPLTTARRGLSIHVEIEPTSETGLTSTSYAQCELVRSVNRRRLVHHLGRIEADTSHDIAEVVKTLLDH